MQRKVLEEAYLLQLPTVAAMLIPDHVYDDKEVAAEALGLINGILDVLEEEGVIE